METNDKRMVIAAYIDHKDLTGSIQLGRIPADDLDRLKKLLRCEMVQAITRNVEGRALTLWVDEEGLMTPKRVTALGLRPDAREGMRMRDAVLEELRGSIVITRMDDEGEMQDLTKEDIDAIEVSGIEDTADNSFFRYTVGGCAQ